MGGPDEDGDDEDLADEAEPLVPAGLRELSDSLASVAEFLKIDDDLIAAAAQASGPLVPAGDDGIADWVTALAASEKDKFLTMVAEGEGTQVEALLVQGFRRESRPTSTSGSSTGRTAEARARRAAEQAAAYERRLEKLAVRKDETWQQVEELTMFSKPKEYDQAT